MVNNIKKEAGPARWGLLGRKQRLKANLKDLTPEQIAELDEYYGVPRNIDDIEKAQIMDRGASREEDRLRWKAVGTGAAAGAGLQVVSSLVNSLVHKYPMVNPIGAGTLASGIGGGIVGSLGYRLYGGKKHRTGIPYSRDAYADMIVDKRKQKAKAPIEESRNEEQSKQASVFPAWARFKVAEEPAQVPQEKANGNSVWSNIGGAYSGRNIREAVNQRKDLREQRDNYGSFDDYLNQQNWKDRILHTKELKKNYAEGQQQINNSLYEADANVRNAVGGTALAYGAPLVAGIGTYILAKKLKEKKMRQHNPGYNE